MTYRLYRFGSTVLPDYNEESDAGLAASGKSALDLPTGGALDLFGGERITIGSSRPTKACTLHAATEAALLTSFMALRALVGTREQLYRMRIADGLLEWVWARFDKLTAMRKYGGRSRFFQDVSLAFTIYSPAWYGALEQHEHRVDVGIHVDDLTTCHAESNGPPVTSRIVIANDGNVDQRDVTFTITSVQGVTSVVVTNVSTGHIWSFPAIADGTALVVDCGEMSVENNGVDAYDDFTAPANREEWFLLQPGANIVTIELDGDVDLNANINIQFYDAFA